MAQIISSEQAAALIKDGCNIMIGGFMGCGSSESVTAAMLKSNVKNLFVIATDMATPDKKHGRLVANRQVKKLIASHIGTNPEVGKQMIAGEMDVTLVPQGTLAERIRAAGAGLGGILTPTGLGTVVADEKQIIKVNGIDYLLEEPLFADIALVYASTADSYGNLSYQGTTRNFNTVMPMACKTVIVEVDKIIDGAMDPNLVITPGIFIDYIVLGGN